MAVERPNFCIAMHDDGTMSCDHRRPTKRYVRVVVKLKDARPNSSQAKAIFQLISKHKVRTAAFYDFRG